MNQIHLNLICYGASLLLAIVLTPLAIRLARRFGLVDRPGVRKIHRVPVPRIGGISIGIATVGAFAIAACLAPPAILHAGHESSKAATLLVGAFSLMLLGIADDIYGVAALYKLFVILAVSTLFCFGGGVIQSVVICRHDLFDLGPLAQPVTVLFLVGVTVSINFIDGLDGLAAGIVAIACGVLAVGAAVSGFPLPVMLTLSLLGALCGFLMFNLHPAKLFMGDCGSMFIGFTLAASCVLCNGTIGTTRAILLPGLALSIPLLDTFFTMIRRAIIQRRSLFAPERGHVHHRLLDSGMRHPHVVLLLHLITLLAAGVGMVCIFANHWATAILATAFLVLLLGVFRAAGTTRARETILSIRRNRFISREKSRFRNTFYHLQLGFREADTIEGWREQLVRSAEALEFGKLNLAMTSRDGNRITVLWRRDGRELARADSLTAEVPIASRRSGECLRVEVEVDNGRFLESSGFRLSLFAELVKEYGLDKIPTQPSIATNVNRAKILSAQSNLSAAVSRLSDGEPTIAAG